MPYWGKAGEDGYHLLTYHSLDVAAVGKELLAIHPTLAERLAHLLDIDRKTLEFLAVFLLALHDLGKFSVRFQNLRPDLLNALQNRASGKEYNERHDTLGFMLWHKKIKALFHELGLVKVGKGRRVSSGEVALDAWIAAVTGHHGTPPKPINLLLEDYFEEEDQGAAESFVEAVTRLLIPDGFIFPEINDQVMKKASWWIAGFTVLCDWIGSNSDYFIRQSHIEPLEVYWERSRDRAHKAIAATELLPTAPADSMRLSELIQGIDTAESTPLQKLASGLSLGNGPQMFILEDVTGAGKTEAALILAQRLMADGRAQGIYFGLPTMATANAMYQRLGSHGYRQLYQVGTQPSLVLAHGAAHLSDDFRQSIVPPASTSDGEYRNDEPAASAHCSQWLADNRKKALLADAGIGTIDQALLAILPSRHQSLRLLGLLGKVLLVDEVHACDTYMHRLLCRLLKAHATAGGSVILLSATLPQKQRQALTASFQEGLGSRVDELNMAGYPLLTQVGDNTILEESVSTRAVVRRHVTVRCMEDIEAVEREIAMTIENDQCACWIRNTVGDALETYTRLRARYPEWNIELFHARYAMADRLDIEQRVLDRFGKSSRHEQRAGRLLIATQVVEQSLDLDFDYLVTDLAPIDLIIQRAGRLRRHGRDSHGNPVEAPDQRGTPVLGVYVPVWQDEPDHNWFAGTFNRAQGIYPDHGQLWLTHKLLREQGGFHMPEDARFLIESVYAFDADIPEGLLGRASRAQGDARAEASMADLNGLDIDQGYNDPAINRWWDDTRTPTRLGELTTTLWLACWQDGRIRPWRDDLPFAWQQSSVNIRSALISGTRMPDNISEDVISNCREVLPAKGKWGVLVIMTEHDNNEWLATITNDRGQESTLHYAAEYGLLTDSDYKNVEGVFA
ncbi:MAG: CRISPR-associated helicase/endonuclease Cas3 [marine bacterium B5-7]|nr:MAG: CRISPR-associated helicase/endonuclease Cas3 [marine bacterium B5-7]